jgi:ABC-type Fe3+-hydroxamate transport system substrate-binding protein
VFADSDRPTLTVSPERVSDLDPDVVILLGPPPDRLPRSHYLRRFQGIRAVRRDMVFGIEGREALEKGPSGVEKLVAALKGVLLSWQARSDVIGADAHE